MRRPRTDCVDTCVECAYKLSRLSGTKNAVAALRMAMHDDPAIKYDLARKRDQYHMLAASDGLELGENALIYALLKEALTNA